MVVDEVEPELGALAEVRQEPAQRSAILAAVRRLGRGPARHGLEVFDERTAERSEVGALVGERAESQEDLFAAARHEVVAGEISADGLRLRRIPVKEADRLGRQVVGEPEGNLEHLLRQVGLAKFRARHAQRRHVEMVDRGIDATLDERALAPVHHHVAKAKIELVPAEVPTAIDECVEQAQVGTGEILALLGNRRARRLRILDQVVV